MQANSLQGRSALVTGSVQGIGLAIAKALASAGARIAVHGLADAQQIDAALSAVRNAGAPEAKFFDGDMRDPNKIDALMHAVAAWGGADILVNNAGVQHTVSMAELTTEIWDKVISINLSAAAHTMRHALPAMAKRGYGRVINISSVHGLVASIHKAPYVASKFGLIGLSRVAALEYANVGSRATGGVTVNCICPGWTETPLIEPQILARAGEFGGDRTAGIASLLAEKQPSRRLSGTDEIGQVVVWLSDPIAHNITGVALPIDGGWTSQ
jgi:3-hydroxybutyrate dehydrogenase